MPTGIIQFDEFELDLSRYALTRRGQPVKLEKTPMELLILLAEREGRLVTREEIIARLWGEDVFVDTRQGINTAIRKIRIALRDDPDEPRVVETVFGKGYRLASPVVIKSPDAPAAAPVVEEPADGTAARQAELTASAASGTVEESGAQINSSLARGLFLLIQVWYLFLYGLVFEHMQRIGGLPGVPRAVPQVALITGLVGASAHIYLMFAVAFKYHGAGKLFRQMFPALLVLDLLWAGSPLLLFSKLGFVTILLVAPLAFLPFSQRTVMKWAYPRALTPVPTSS